MGIQYPLPTPVVIPELRIPGGQLVAGMGGYLTVTLIGAPLQAGASTHKLDVGLWEVMGIFRSTEVTHSGCEGAIARRRVAYDYVFRCEIPYDAANPPNILLSRGAGVGVCFQLGDPGQYLPGLDQKYVSPSALLENAQTVTNSTGTDIVRQEVTGRGNSLMYHLPYAEEEYFAYLARLQARGWL